MKVVLIQDVKGLGRRNEVRQVSDGYARNFLFPRGLAVAADSAGLARHQAVAEGEQTELREAKTAAQAMGELKLTFNLKAKGASVFGSVTKVMIEEVLREQGIKDATVELPKALHALGEHKIAVRLGHGVTGEILITVRAQPQPS